MPDNDDDIPVLTDAIDVASRDKHGLSDDELATLEARLSAVSLQMAEELLRDACREAENVLMKRVMNELRAALPGVINRSLREHFDK
jgi:hypothetical protein